MMDKTGTGVSLALRTRPFSSAAFPTLVRSSGRHALKGLPIKEGMKAPPHVGRGWLRA